MEVFYQWSEQHLGQSHYIIGYIIVLIGHNWPIIVSLGAALVMSIRLYRQLNRANAVWLFSALLFGLGYEYEKHVAGELHHAIDMLFGLELTGWNRPLHMLVGPVFNTVFVVLTLTMVLHGLQLSFGSTVIKLFRRLDPARIEYHRGGITASCDASLEGEDHERAGNDSGSA
ncbi:hypothetical protein [Chloroflexus sp.]|uniref:hypothetical protein n=1 Tax=Chloroflexus sp. TaxID=1904827 RepID=UPI002ADDD4EB|nr:hypothetical protein [Chloroflexus sp.]